MQQTTSPRAVSRQHHYKEPPQKQEIDGSPTWITRGDTFVVAITEVRAGTELLRPANRDEYMVVIPPGLRVTVQAGYETLDSEGDALIIVPPGASQLRSHGSGIVARIFSACAQDLAGLSANAQLYTDSDETVPGPAPLGGYHLRQYRLADYYQPDGNLIQPRIFRSDSLMINAFVPFRAPRPTDNLRPHWHDDFEQGSVAMRGTWIHHLRTPWGIDLSTWKEDEHLEIGAPSVTVFPATVIHASRNLTPDAWLLDVFSPPREDFLHTGLVLNAEEYPQPEKNSTSQSRDVPKAWRAQRA